jgi:hypothetical protein
MSAIKLTNYIGMNNKAAQTALPPDKLRHAHNVLFDNQNKIIFPRYGKDSVYSGNCHSFFSCPFVKLFVDNGILQVLNDDNTATSLTVNVGSDSVSYTLVGDTVYFSNATTRGRIVAPYTEVSEWGVERPLYQPTCTAIDTGGMFAGEYRVAITFIGSRGDESGTGISSRVTVNESGGIQLTDFPPVPFYVTYIGVYVSSVNSEELYLYGEYPTNTTTLDIARLANDDEIPAVPLITQHCFPPVPVGLCLAHYGRIYYVINNFVYWTEEHNYSLQRAGNYWTFDSDIQTIVSCPNVLYVGTITTIYKITNIGGDEPAINEEQQDCGTVKGSECYDPDGVAAYFMSERGIIKATPEGLQELTYENVAIPFYLSGSMTVTQQDGLKYLHFIGDVFSINPLQSASYTEDYQEPPSSWHLNLSTGAISNGTLSGNSISNGYIADTNGIYTLFGSNDNGVTITGIIQTGKLDFNVETQGQGAYQKRVTDAYIAKEGGRLLLTVETENSSIGYGIRTTEKMENVKVDLALGSKGRYWQYKLQNVLGQASIVDNIELEVNVLLRRHG